VEEEYHGASTAEKLPFDNNQNQLKGIQKAEDIGTNKKLSI
jgi:hypothetical protein